MIVTCPRTIYIYLMWSPSQLSQIQESSGTYWYLHFLQQTTNPVTSFCSNWIRPWGSLVFATMNLDTFLTGGQADKTTNKVRLPLFWSIYTRMTFCRLSLENFFLYKKLREIISQDLICPESCKGTPYAAQVVTLPCHRTEIRPSCQLNGFSREICPPWMFSYKYTCWCLIADWLSNSFSNLAPLHALTLPKKKRPSIF